MERDEDCPKNVKEIVNKFEITNDKKCNSPDRNERISPLKVQKQTRSSVKNEPQSVNAEKNRVAAIKESFEKSMNQEYVSNRSLPSVGRSLADLKKDLSKSMEFSETKIPVQNNLNSSRIKNKNALILTRYNSTDALNHFADDSSRSIYPIPAPRLNISSDRRHQSSSDLTSALEPTTPTSMHNSTYQDLRSNDFLENILEVSGLSSSNDELNKSTESRNEGSIVTDDLVNGLDCNNFNGAMRKQESFVDIESLKNSSSLYCCRLHDSKWNEIILSLVSEEEEIFIGSMISVEFDILSGENDKTPLNLLCDFDSIVDVLTFQSESMKPESFVQKNSSQNISKEELASAGRGLETSLTVSLNEINAELTSLVKTEKEVFDRIFKIDLAINLKSKFGSLLQRIDGVINLLFLLNRMLQHKAKETCSKNKTIQTKLNDAKEIKKNLDLDCQRLLVKLEHSIPKQYFEEFLHILTTKLSLSLKKECISFKLKRIPKILDLLETYHV